MSHITDASNRFATKRILTNSSNRRQSIKLEIDLPMNLTCDNNNSNSSTYSYNNYEQHDSTNNLTICLKISIDNHADNRRANNRTTRTPHFPMHDKVSSLASSSSGYSSSMSTSSSSQCLDDNINFPLNYSINRTPVQNPLFCNENIYDRLSYSNKRRCSIASSNSSNATDSAPVSECDIYEEITNLTTKHVYCNEPIQAVQPINRNVVKRREYTVNEIFQNVNSFKEEANKQEVNQIGQAKSVNILKQLFEVNKKSKLSPMVRKVASPKPALRQHNHEQHVYVNEKISSGVIV